MAKSRLVLTADTNLPVATLQNILSDTAGTSSGLGTKAFQTMQFSGPAAPADTVTINSVTLTAVASSPSNNQFIAGVNAQADAAALAAAINASTTAGLKNFVNAASDSSAIVYIHANAVGAAGNSLTVAKSSSAITLAGSTLSAGSDPQPSVDHRGRAREFANKVNNFFRALNAGARAAVVNSGVVDSGASDAVAASQIATFSDAATAADTFTINGVAFTAVASGATGNQWNVSALGTAPLRAAADAASLAAAINASATDAAAGVVRASASGAVVTIACLIPGAIGNAIAVAKSSTAITLGGAALASGAGRLPSLTSFSFGK